MRQKLPRASFLRYKFYKNWVKGRLIAQDCRVDVRRQEFKKCKNDLGWHDEQEISNFILLFFALLLL